MLEIIVSKKNARPPRDLGKRTLNEKKKKKHVIKVGKKREALEFIPREDTFGVEFKTLLETNIQNLISHIAKIKRSKQENKGGK